MKRREPAKSALMPTETFPLLTPAVFCIPMALAEGERHGYAIMQQAAERSDGTVRLGPGTPYAAISRMLKEDNSSRSLLPPGLARAPAKLEVSHASTL